jgi:hypothetical protein
VRPDPDSTRKRFDFINGQRSRRAAGHEETFLKEITQGSEGCPSIADLDHGKTAVLNSLTNNTAFAAFESPDGVYLYYNQSMDTPSPLWRLPTSGGIPRSRS